MPLTLLLSGALLPAGLDPGMVAELVMALRVPRLACWLQRATALSHQATAPQPARDAWLAAQLIHAPAQPTPLAPYAWRELGGDDPGPATLWFADALHVAIGRDSLVVQPLPAPPADAQADALIEAANECLAGSGATVHRRGKQWFLQTDDAWSLRPAPLDALPGAPFQLPSADEPADARRWARLHNAIQMAWHQHPVNSDRDTHGAPQINALWLHGGGRWTPLPALRWARVFSDDPGVRGAARATGAEAANLAEPWTDNALIDVPHAQSAAGVGEGSSWLTAMAALDRELARAPSVPSIEVVLTSHAHLRSWQVQPSDWLRFWRRNDLAAALTAMAADG